MGRIGATLSGIELTLLNRLARAGAAAATNSLRLATGEKINSPKDNPSDFLALSRFRTHLNTVTRTLTNVTSASSIVSQTQLTLDLIRTQLNTIRTKAVEDEDQALSTSARAANQAAIDTAITEINRLAGTEINGRRVLDGSATFAQVGKNPSQIFDLQVRSVGGPTQSVAAKQAEIVYTGSGGVVTAAANITLTGALGAATVAVTTSDSLAQIAARINQDALDTGVTAAADGNQLRIRSVQFGANQTVKLQVNSGTFTVTGADAGGVARGVDAAIGARPSISGTVLSPGTQARLVHDAGGANISSNATLTIAGNRGSAVVAVTTADTLAQAVNRINLESHLTGVTASVDGTRIVFNSVTFGANASIQITTPDTFTLTGGNGDGTANGANAVAKINGVTVSGNRAASKATLIHEEPTGLFTLASTFTLTGPLGTSALITVNVSDSLATVAGLINAENASTGISAAVDGTQLVLTSDTAASTAQISLNVVSGAFAVDGGNGDGTATGADAVTGVGTVDGNRFIINDNEFRYEIEFASGFEGDFDTVTIQDGALRFALSTDVGRLSTLSVPGLQAARLGGLSGTLDRLATGGSASGLNTNAPLAIRIVDEALGDLDRIEGLVDGFANATIASSSGLLSAFQSDLEDAIDDINQADVTAESLLLDKNTALANNALAGLSILNQQRNSIVSLIQQIAGLT